MISPRWKHGDFFVYYIYLKDLKSPKVAVVILNYNGSAMLRKFLPSVLASEYNCFDVVVADNASSDDSIDVLEKFFPSVKVIRLRKNLGYAGGYNAALQQVSADYFVLLNSDVEVDKHWIQPVISLMESDVTIAACQPKILAYHNRTHFEYAGAAGGFLDRLGYPLARGRVLDYLEVDGGQYDSVVPVFWASGAAFFVRSSVFKDLGGFDAEFFAHQEEIDLCWRIQLAGHKVYCCPKSVVYHVGGGTLPKSSYKLYLNFRNSLRMLSKNLHPSERFSVLFGRLMMDAAFVFKSILTLKWKEASAAVRAWCETCFRYKPMRAEQPKKFSHLTGVIRRSLVIQYYLKGKKTFKQIVSNK